LTVAQRELIAAYVSALNACGYCAGIHTATAEAFGVPENVVTALLADVDTAPVEEAMKPLLRLVGTLTRSPARIRDAEVVDVYEAGWDEQALHDAVSVCALFDFMNRLVEGPGITATPDYYRTSSQRLAGAAGYAGLRHLLPPAEDDDLASGTAAGP
jgi:uncharacterized peroxidase-related enzyme